MTRQPKSTRVSFTINETPDDKGIVGFIYADSPEIAHAMHARILGLSRFRNAKTLLPREMPETVSRPMFDVLVANQYPETVIRFVLAQRA